MWNAVLLGAHGCACKSVVLRALHVSIDREHAFSQRSFPARSTPSPQLGHSTRRRTITTPQMEVGKGFTGNGCATPFRADFSHIASLTPAAQCSRSSAS
eukprot:15390382-Alexandrium_andersonii.AAC.1